jgi:capsular polysaccharide biosynthesis protein
MLLRRRLWLVVVLAVTAGVAAFLVTQRLPKLYEASATVLVSVGDGSLGTDLSGNLAPDRVVATYAELLKSRQVIEPVFHDLAPGLSYDEALRRVDVTPRPGTQLLGVTARSPDPKQAAQIADELVSVAIQQVQTLQAEQSTAQRDRLTALADAQAANLAARTRDVNDWSAQPPSPSRDDKLLQAQAQLNLAQQSYLAAARQLQADSLAASRASNTLTLVGTAATPTSPAQPRLPLNVGFGIGLGLVLGVLLVVVLEVTAEPLVTERRVQSRPGLPLLASVEPRWSTFPSNPSGLPTPDIDQVFAPVVARVEGLLRDDSATTVLVSTVDAGGEQRSWTGVALAIGLARSRERVALVDAKIEGHGVDEIFGIASGGDLMSVLASGASAKVALASTSVDGLGVLRRGDVPEDAVDLVCSTLMDEVISELCRMASVIVVEGSPLSESGGVGLVSKVGHVVIVADPARVKMRQLELIVQRIERMGAQILGVVLERESTGPPKIVPVSPPKAIQRSALTVGTATDAVEVDRSA